MKKLGLMLEMELGVTGGEEDGVDNTGVKSEDLYSKPEEIYEVRRGVRGWQVFEREGGGYSKPGEDLRAAAVCVRG